MKKTIELPATIEACHAMIIEMARQIEQLQRPTICQNTAR